jgi:hypothetical protein
MSSKCFKYYKRSIEVREVLVTYYTYTRDFWSSKGVCRSDSVRDKDFVAHNKLVYVSRGPVVRCKGIEPRVVKSPAPNVLWRKSGRITAGVGANHAVNNFVGNRE